MTEDQSNKMRHDETSHLRRAINAATTSCIEESCTPSQADVIMRLLRIGVFMHLLLPWSL